METTTNHLIVGGGMTADAACKGIRDLDPESKVVLVGDDPHPPYARPPLSKALWKGNDEDSIWRGTADLGVDLRLGRRIVELDLESRTARDDQGETYAYERLLLATGGRPRKLAFGGDEVVYYRTFDDYKQLRSLADSGARVLVIGGGFIGSEIAAALAMNGRSVTMIFPEPGIGARIFPSELAASLVDYYRERGVEVLPEATATGIEWDGTGRVTVGDDRVLEADAVVAGIGIEPSAELAEKAGLPVSNGIVVDSFGQVGGREDVFAAGDVARFPVPALDGETRVEHEDHAISHGRQVGANMAGAGQPYDHLPFFYSDLFDVGYEAVGELDSRLERLTELGELGEKGIVYYLDGDRRPRGVLLWNQFGRVDEARDLIRAGAPIPQGAGGPL
jgi:NADPH-dependent 2,4-dienoyl-CoA reductase/sulfur reductase-like enzyme